MVEQVQGCPNNKVLKLSLKSARFDKFIHLLENNVGTISCSYLVHRQFDIFICFTVWNLCSGNEPKLLEKYSR